MRKNKLALTLAILLCLILIVPYKANAQQNTVTTITVGTHLYVPINTIVQQMGGKVERYEADKYTMVTINGKTARIDDTWGFAEIDGKFTPYETTVVNSWIVPTYKKPIVKDGISYVPVDFLKSKLGLALYVIGDKVIFNAVDGGKGSNNTSNTSSGGSSNSGTTNNNTSGKTSGQAIYTGNEVKQKLYGLGFVNYNGGLKLNPYGAKGLSEYDYMTFMALDGEQGRDISLCIFNSNSEVDQKIRTICNYILPNQGNYFYSSVLDNPNTKSETIYMDGRKIEINVASFGVVLYFGPIVK